MQRPLDRKFGFAIRVDRTLRRRLADRDGVGRAIGRAARRKDDLADAGFPHRFEQRQAAAQIVAVVERRITDGFADIGERRKMHYGGHLMFFDRSAQPRAVADVAFDQRAPTRRFAVAARQIVVNDRAITGSGQSLARVRADIPSAAGDQNGLRHTAFGFVMSLGVQRHAATAPSAISWHSGAATCRGVDLRNKPVAPPFLGAFA